MWNWGTNLFGYQLRGTSGGHTRISAQSDRFPKLETVSVFQSEMVGGSCVMQSVALFPFSSAFPHLERLQRSADVHCRITGDDPKELFAGPSSLGHGL